MTQPDQAGGGKKRRWKVTGLALVPVQIEISIDAPTAMIAGQAAQRLFDQSNRKKDYIVHNSEDLSAVHDFRWSEVEELSVPPTLTPTPSSNAADRH